MNNKTIQIIIGSGVLALVLLVSVQFFWAQNIISLQKKQFNHKVKIALNNTGYQLRLIQHESISKIHPVKQIDSKSFVVEVQDIINPVTIDSLLQKEFKDLEIDQPYKLAIYDCFTDSVVYTHGGTKEAISVDAEDYGVDWNINSYNFGVVFPHLDKNTEGVKVWFIAIIVVLIVSVFFVFVIQTLLKQKKLDEMKTDFINNMTHELKTPISTISLSSQVLANPKIIEQPERLNRYANIIIDENNRLKNQVERVLQMAFYEREDLPLNFVETNVVELLNGAIRPYELKLQERKGTIEVEGDDCYIKMDEQHMTNVFSNLIDNAIKYCDKQPQIKINVISNNDEVSISFTDNGIGMSNEDTKNIFKKFYRVSTGDKHDVKGFGIGLSYVQLMVQKHHGTIKVTSEVGKGTTFVLTLPVNNK